MTIIKGFLTVVVTALIFGFSGALIGWALGAISPDFYHVMFSHAAENPNFSPARFGFAIGAVNGLIWGMVLGILIVLAVTFFEARKQAK